MIHMLHAENAMDDMCTLGMLCMVLLSVAGNAAGPSGTAMATMG